jgi:hypothetical protein
MSNIISPAIAKRLLHAVERFRDEVHVPPPNAWTALGDAALWARVLGQIAVAGRADSGTALRRELGPDLDSWYEHLKRLPDAGRREEIHRRLRDAGVRYVTQSAETCKKSKAAEYNFNILLSYGGPRRFFEQLSLVPVATWRISIVASEMSYIKLKGARDLLIELGLVQDAIALDSRLKAVLTRLGATLPEDIGTNSVLYAALEHELLEKVCAPSSITGGHLDRILFSRWKSVA